MLEDAHHKSGAVATDELRPTIQDATGIAYDEASWSWLAAVFADWLLGTRFGRKTPDGKIGLSRAGVLELAQA